MQTLKKFVLIKILEIAKEKGLNTIDELIVDINKYCKYDTDVVFSWKLEEKISGKNKK